MEAEDRKPTPEDLSHPSPPATLGTERRARPVARPLVPVALALMVGIASAAWGVDFAGTWLLAGLAALWLALALIRLARRPARFLPLAFFWLLGVAFYQQAQQPFFPTHHVLHLPPEQETALLGRLDRPGKLGPERVQLFVAVEARLSPEGWLPATGKLLVTTPHLEPPPVGTKLVVRGRLRTPRVLKNPATFDRPRHLATDGIFREIRLKDRHDLIFLASSAAYPLGEKLRGGIRQLLKGMAPTLRAIYLSMLLGDQGEVTPEMRVALARTGTSHLLVINGLHLSMAAAVTYFISFWLLRRSTWLLLRVNVLKIATLLAAATVVGYAWVAGGSPSTQRAEIMVLAYLLLVFLGRPREIWSALALAALVILSLAPLRLFAISFQLSFVAVAAIIYLVPRLVRGVGETVDADRLPNIPGRVWFRVKEWSAVSIAATLATAPLVAHYFQVVSLLGIVVNLAAIPLVLGLALPLGEAAVLAKALHLTPLAEWLLFLGKFPLWLGYAAVEWGARVPGSAIITPIPTWVQVTAYYLLLVLLFAPRRTYLTRGGAVLAGVVLLGSILLPGWRPPHVLEVTCLDSYGSLEGVVVTPENRRLVVSAAAPTWPGRPGGALGPLPGYCHWRQFRRLDLAVALAVSQDNAGELLSLARQFTVGGYWYGRRGREGPDYWDLWNFLGDRQQAPRSLERGRPPAMLGSVGLNFPSLGSDQGVALQLTYQGRTILILPPVPRLTAPNLPVAGVPAVELLILSANLAGTPEMAALMSRWKPKRAVIYGGEKRGAASGDLPGGIPCSFTRDGAVSVSFSESGITIEQWGR